MTVNHSQRHQRENRVLSAQEKIEKINHNKTARLISTGNLLPIWIGVLELYIVGKRIN